MGKIVAIANQKGGVGKTTTTINLGASLAILEKRVLVIDLDPQANSTTGLGIRDTNLKNIYDCLVNNVTLKEAIVSTATPNLDIIPSHIDLVGAEIELVSKMRREFILTTIIKPIKDDYDFILIDCLPSLGLLTINALTAAESVLIPIQCEIFALEGLSKLKNTIKLVKEQLNSGLEVEGILLSMFDRRLRLGKMVLHEIQNSVQDYVFETVIHRNSKISESPSLGQPVITYDASSKGSDNFMNLAVEFLEKNTIEQH